MSNHPTPPLPLLRGGSNNSLSIIIVNRDHKYFPQMALESIEKANIKVDYEVIFVDNASTDESIEFLRKMQKEKKINLIEAGGNLGYGQGNNLGVTKAKGKYILIMNPDVFPQKNSINKLLDYLEKKEFEVGIVGPKLIYYNGTIQPSCRRFMTFTDLVIKRTFLKKLPYFRNRLKKYLMHDFDHTKTQEVDLITGAAMLMKKDLFQRLEGFDQRYFLFMEDFDLCQRVHKLGMKVVYLPSAEMIHYHKRLSDGGFLHLIFKKPFWYHLISCGKYFWRWRR